MFNIPNHSHHNMTICGLSLHHGNTENRKNLEQKFIFQLGTLSDLHTELMNASYSQIHVTIFPPMAKLLYTLIQTTTPTVPLFALTKGNARKVSFLNLSRW